MVGRLHTERVLHLPRARVRRALAPSLAEELLNGMHDGMALHDAAGDLIVWNPAAATLTGWTMEEAATEFPADLAEGLSELHAGAWIDVRRVAVERRGRKYIATLFTDARQQVALREAYGRLSDAVTTDALTGLPNRLLADDRLRLSVHLAKRDSRSIAVLYVDLDRFKLINDTLGHQAGDVLLQEVALRLRSAIRESDTVARIGGDEFVVILHALSSPSDAEKVAASILAALSESFTLGDRDVFVGGSVGIAVFPEHGDAPDTLLSHADLAMYRAKADGGNAARFYAPIMSEVSRDRLLIAGDLHRALARNELVVHYQPQIDTNSGMVVGAEALLRWQHPLRGLTGPDAFLDVAEEDGTILEIDRWVLRTACEQTKRWDDAGLYLPTIAVNVSARTMIYGDVVGMVAGALASSRLAPHRLEIEVSEHVVAGQTSDVEKTLSELKDLGVLLAIDDFGTGYSSLGHLKRFPIDAIKLDRSFVIDVTGQPDPADIAVLRAVVNMAADLQLRCIAEGVETVEQRKVLRFLRCHLVQGFLYSQAVSAEAFGEHLNREGVDLQRPFTHAGG